MVDKQTKKNAYLYCKFRDEQFAEYDHFAKEKGILMNTFLVLNTLYYAKEGLTQNQICENTHQSKQTISLLATMTPSASAITQMAQIYDKDAEYARNQICKLLNLTCRKNSLALDK